MKLPFEKRSPDILVRQDAATNPLFGGNPKNRTVEELLKASVVVIDKPKGPTSHQIAEWTKRIVGTNKAGQSGTLDPGVTGVLPVGIGHATKLLGVLLSAGKEYVCSMHLHADVAPENIQDVMLNQFVGKIKQLPPLKSAIKRQWRMRHIYYIDIIEIEGREILFRVGCQAGTYIRKLCHDIGDVLGCGAHMAQLIRTRSGGFSWDERVTLQDLSDALHVYKKEGRQDLIRQCLLPPEELVRHLPKLWIIDEAVDSLTHGVPLHTMGVAKTEGDIEPGQMVAVMTLKDELVLIGRAQQTAKNMLQGDRMAVKTDRVMLASGVYPSQEQKRKQKK
jgi:H/ACA ribonucleoprotein complex subunit 4